EDAWRNVGGTRGLDAAALAAVTALAAWRQRTAIELDRPLGQVLADKAIVELARHRPRAATGVREVKGLSPIAKTRADAIAEAIAGAAPVSTVRPMSRPASARAQRWAEILLAIAHAIADEAGIATRLLATRSD